MSMNACHTYGIVTNDFEKAKEKMLGIIASRDDLKHSSLAMSCMMIEFENGESWRWIQPIHMNRGYRLHRACFDRRLTLEEYEYIQRQMCSLYCESQEWF